MALSHHKSYLEFGIRVCRFIKPPSSLYICVMLPRSFEMNFINRCFYDLLRLPRRAFFGESEILEEPVEEVRLRILRDPTGAVVKTVCELLKLVSNEIEIFPLWKSKLRRLREILEKTDACLTKMSSVDMKLDLLPMDDVLNFTLVARQAHGLIRRGAWTVPREELEEIENSMLSFYLVDLWDLVVAEITKSELSAPPAKLGTNQYKSPRGDMLRHGRETSKKLQGVVVGGRKPIVELKDLIKKGGSPLVISAPPGHGKTTLARQVCEDTAIKGEYGDNIFFFHVSAKPNVAALKSKLREHINCRHHDKIPSDTMEIRELGKLMENIGIPRVLMVLDDVWPESEFLIDEFSFQIPGYNLFVTSRFRFSRFDGYELMRSCESNGKPLYCLSGSDPNGHNANKAEQLPVLVWKSTPKKNAAEDKPVYIENVEGMTKTVSVFDMFETEESDAYVLPENYLENRIMGGSSSADAPLQE